MAIVKRVAALISLAGLCRVIALAATVQLSPAGDAAILESSPGPNLGADSTLQAGIGAAGAARSRALLRFDIGRSVPPGATIVAARLTVSPLPTSAPAQTFSLRRVLQPWNEGGGSGGQGAPAGPQEVTWSHRLSPSVAWSAPGGAIGLDFAAQPSGEWSVNARDAVSVVSTPQLAADVQAWLDTPQANYGWAIINHDETTPQTVHAFASREEPARAPRLEIAFSTDAPGFHVTSFSVAEGKANLAWAGGRAPFQVLWSGDLPGTSWTPLGAPVNGSSATVNANGSQGFFRVISEPTVEYDVVFQATWSAATHPTDFPPGAHWSGLVGGLHNHLAEFWNEGAPSTEGMRRMAELGSKTVGLQEVTAAIQQGTANRTLSGPGIGGGSGTATLRFQIDRTHPLVTLVSMVAPSPDWFVGVRGLPLIENGQWVSSKMVALYPWDTGTDSGATFISADQVTAPRGVVTRIVTPPLATNGNVPVMGTFTFTRVSSGTAAPSPEAHFVRTPALKTKRRSSAGEGNMFPPRRTLFP